MMTVSARPARSASGIGTVAALLLIAPAACNDATGPPNPPPPAERVRLGIGATGLVLAPRASFQMGVTLWEEETLAYHELDELDTLDVRWWSSDAALVEVDPSGVLVGAAEGRAHVWVEVAGHRDSASVLVTANPNEWVRQYSSVSADGSVTCALDLADRPHCWGGDFNGSLGRGRGRKFTKGLTPGPVVGGLVLDTLVSGQFHSCGIARDGTTWCWGQNNSGQLGREDADWDEDPGGWINGVARPVAVAGYRFEFLSLGAYHSCGLDVGGRAYCWGWNVDGELGRGFREGGTHADPRPVETDLRFVELSAGRFHTCARTDDGRAYCWGLNRRRQLGADADDSCPQGACRTTPVAVDTELRFDLLAPGGEHTCGLVTNGALYCWGANGQGEAGQTGGSIIRTPQRVEGAPELRSVVSGSSYSCGLTPTGQAYCWGSNRHGQLGRGPDFEPSHDPHPEPRPVSGNHVFAMLSIQDRHTCGLTRGGEILCWGRNLHGQLGDGTLEMHPMPVRVLHP